MWLLFYLWSWVPQVSPMGLEFRFSSFLCWHFAFSWWGKILASWRNFPELQKSKAKAIYFLKTTWHVWAWHGLVLKSIIPTKKVHFAWSWVKLCRVKVEKKLWRLLLTYSCGLLLTVRSVRVFSLCLCTRKGVQKVTSSRQWMILVWSSFIYLSNTADSISIFQALLLAEEFKHIFFDL